MANLNVQRQELITYLKQTHPELALCSDEQILTIYNEEISKLQLSEDEQISILGGNQTNFNYGLGIENQPLKLSIEEESQLRAALQSRIESVTSKTTETESKNGFIGKAWSWTKNNLLDWCTDSTNDIKKAQEEERNALNGDIKEAFKKITGLDYTRENLDNFLNNKIPTKSEQALQGYEEGQEMAVDFAGDMVSGIAAVAIYTAAVAAAPFTGGASIALGLGLAVASGGLIKSGIKALDAKSAGQEYNSFTKDMITGGFSGLLAPITGGVGGAVGRGIATKLGIQVFKQVGKETIEATGKQTLKTILTNPVGYEYVGKRWGIALASEMAADGALGGSIDGTFRTAYDMHEKGEKITGGALFDSFIQGGMGGFFMAPLIGGGMKVSGKAANKLFGKNADKVVPNTVEKPKPQLPEKINSLSDILTVREAVSDSEADAILRDFGCSNEAILAARKEINDLNTIVMAFDTMRKFKPEDFEAEAPDAFLASFKELSSSELEMIKYMNTENLEIIRTYFCKNNEEPVDVFVKLLDKSNDDQNFNLQLSKTNEIYRLVGTSFAEIFDSVLWRNAEDLELMTPERIMAQYNMDRIIREGDFNAYSCSQISDPSIVTSEFLSAFENNVNKAKKLGITLDYHGDVITYAQKLSNIVEGCEKAGLDFSWYKNTPLDEIEKILNQKDPSIARQFMESCSDKCKERFGYQILSLMSYSGLAENNKLYTRIYNLVADFQTQTLPDILSNPANFVKALKEKGVNDFDGVFKLIKAFDDVDCWPRIGVVNEYIIENGDYDNAVKLILGLAEYSGTGKQSVVSDFITSPYGWAPDKMNFAELITRFQKLTKIISKEDFSDYDRVWMCSSKKTDCVEIYGILKKYGLDDENWVRYFILDDYNNFNAKQIQEKLNVILKDVRANLGDFEEVDDGFLLRILFAKNRNANMLIRDLIEKDALSLNDITSFYWNSNNIDGSVKVISDFFKPETKDFLLDVIKRRNELGFSDNTCIDILQQVRPDNMRLAKILCDDKKFPRDSIKSILEYVREESLELAERLCRNPEFKNEEIADVLYYSPKEAFSIAEDICLYKRISRDDRLEILRSINSFNNGNLTKEIINSDEISEFSKKYFIGSIKSKFRADYAEKIWAQYKKLSTNVKKTEFLDERVEILRSINIYNTKFVEALTDDSSLTIYQKTGILRSIVNDETADYAEKLYKQYKRLSSDVDKTAFLEERIAILQSINNYNTKMAEALTGDAAFTPSQKSEILCSIVDEETAEYAKKLCKEYKKLGLAPDQIAFLVSNLKEVDYRQLQKLSKLAGNDALSQLSVSDIRIACKMADIYGRHSINEIPVAVKKELLRSLVACNEGLFNVSAQMKEMFPLIPADKETYCSLMQALVRSMGVETNALAPAKVSAFIHTLSGLSDTLAKISDTDFANLHITQEFSREQFIRTILDKVKHLSAGERQKVYDYFGFELHANKSNETGFTIIGYPVNLNNGKKLAEINDPNTKSIVESIRADVVRFSEQNSIRCNNPSIEKLLNDVVDVLPELRPQIGKIQHGTHDFSVLHHSLKVLQKISQDTNFNALNESDKKVMMLAALLHDITKIEGISDKTHATEGSFDSFFIAKKFNLSKEEEIKLYTLVRNHEWLGYVNTAKNETELMKRLQSVAYDLCQDNLFEMALMFTHADLRAVKLDDSFHDTTVGASRARFVDDKRVFDNSGIPVSHGNAADIYAKRIKNYIDELKKSQPLLPVTKFPNASTIEKAITRVNSDGTTNIKGVYKDKNGLIVIKYNEVEDWQALGFPPGTTSRGTMVEELGVDTGNLKFFVHGLDYVNQLAKFDVFGLVDSDVLLSVSYAERPESKFRFFRTQGVILDVNTKYIHGGGESDSGSGYGKFLNHFKNRYLFGADRESDRLYVSKLIKQATGMNDEEYVAFVKANENKSMQEIEPADVREKIIQAFATINSRTRKGERAYNEMYVTNPEVMGVFAYAREGLVGNALSFIQSNPTLNFLVEYAIKRDLPFVVFGD